MVQKKQNHPIIPERYQRPPLHISLATVVKEIIPLNEKEPSTTTSLKVRCQEIERSILRKILYGADASKLRTLSRNAKSDCLFLELLVLLTDISGLTMHKEPAISVCRATA